MYTFVGVFNYMYMLHTRKVYVDNISILLTICNKNNYIVLKVKAMLSGII